MDLQKKEMTVKDVILVAQGEMALEEFLKMVCSNLCLSIGCYGYDLTIGIVHNT